MGLTSLIRGFRALGLEVPPRPSLDVSFEHIAEKITNPAIAQKLGASRSIGPIRRAEFVANLLDSFSESGDLRYLYRAEEEYQELLRELPAPTRSLVSTAAASAFNYFSYERSIARRIENGDKFGEAELIEYLLRRGSDAPIYALLVQELDGIRHPGLVFGFRARQALWDLADDICDLEEDRRSLGANILLLANLRRPVIRKIAQGFLRDGKKLLRGSEIKPLLEEVENEHRRVIELLAA